MASTNVRLEALRLEQAKLAIKKMKLKRREINKPAMLRAVPTVKVSAPSTNDEDFSKESLVVVPAKPAAGSGTLRATNEKPTSKLRKVSWKRESLGDSDGEESHPTPKLVKKKSTRCFDSWSTDDDEPILTVKPKKCPSFLQSPKEQFDLLADSPGGDQKVGALKSPAAYNNLEKDSPFLTVQPVTQVYSRKNKCRLLSSNGVVEDGFTFRSHPLSPKRPVQCEQPVNGKVKVKLPDSSMIKLRKIKQQRTMNRKGRLLKWKMLHAPMLIKKTCASVKCPVFSVSLDDSFNRDKVKSGETNAQFSNKNHSDTFTSKFNVTTVSDNLLPIFEASCGESEDDENEKLDKDEEMEEDKDEEMEEDKDEEMEEEEDGDKQESDQQNDLGISSPVEDNGVQQEEEDEELLTSDLACINNKTCRPKKLLNDFSRMEFHLIDDQVILQLKHPASFTFCGQVDVEVLKGAVEILGYLLTPGRGSNTVFSPRGCSLLTLQTVSIDEDYSVELDSSLVSSLVQKGDEDDVFLLMKKAENTLSLFLEQYVDITLFPDMTLESSENKLSKVNHKLQCSCSPSPNRNNVFQKGELWDQISLNIIEKPGCSVLCGGKGVGKSTMLRYLVNRLLSNGNQGVLLIDFDPGQAELTIPGCVSMSVVTKPLLGPNFTHLQNPLKCIYVGDINISNCVSRYMDACLTIVNQWQSNEQLKAMPCLVNTMGFNKGIGVPIMVHLLSVLQPTRVVQILSKSSLRNYPELLSVEYVKKSCSSSPFYVNVNAPHCNLLSQNSLNYELNVIETEADMGRDVRSAMGLDPRMSREIVLLSYLAQMVSLPNNSILDVVPYCCRLDSIYLSICHESVPPSITLAAFNANLVALCTVTPQEQDVVSLSGSGFPPVITKRFTTDCLGFGIVRGIDVETQQLYLLTPVPPDVLISVNCLVLGAISLPQSVHFAPPREPGAVPYVIESKSQHSNQQSRRNFQFTYFKKYNAKA